MKKLLVFVLFLVSIASVDTIAQTVYATKTGTKYHTKSCRYAAKSGYPISLPDAKAKGLTPCSVCDPTTKESNQSTQTTTNLAQQYSAPSSSETKVYITKSGTKYHKATCRYASTGWEVPLSEAKQKGLTPCSICKPPNQ